MPSLFPLAASLMTLYSSLDPTSVAQHFAFYELYPKTEEGKEALKTAWELLGADNLNASTLPTLDPQPLIQFVNRSDHEALQTLDGKQIAVVDQLSSHLLNRALKGYGMQNLQAILQLPVEEIDIGRTLLLADMGEALDKIQSYEASLDLMALQIQARLTKESNPLEKIRAINDYIFSEMRFRFPPHSLHAKEIDIYTFLPSVLDSRRGVCLGVSILYLCLAQRLGVPLEAITPPGHIYVRYVAPDGEILNIETTARGIDVPSEMYLGIETRKLQKRNAKEVIGLAFMNQAAVHWRKKEFPTAIALYEKARPFLGDDLLLNTFLGFNYLFVGREKEGRALLERVRGVIPDHGIMADTVVEDYLENRTSAEAILAIYSEVDETRSSILEKQKILSKVVADFPKFRQGWFHLAITWLQLGREKEALPFLEKYVEMNPTDATARYYLAAIHLQRYNFNKAWAALLASEKLVAAKDHKPRALKELRFALRRACPEPSHLF